MRTGAHVRVKASHMMHMDGLCPPDTQTAAADARPWQQTCSEQKWNLGSGGGREGQDELVQKGRRLGFCLLVYRRVFCNTNKCAIVLPGAVKPADGGDVATPSERTESTHKPRSEVEFY